MPDRIRTQEALFRALQRGIRRQRETREALEKLKRIREGGEDSLGPNPVEGQIPSPFVGRQLPGPGPTAR